MAILQHELQHVLDYATGALRPGAMRPAPRNWIYRYELKPGARWRDFGAEQRASIVEDYWRIERGLKAGRGRASSSTASSSLGRSDSLTSCGLRAA